MNYEWNTDMSAGYPGWSSAALRRAVLTRKLGVNDYQRAVMLSKRAGLVWDEDKPSQFTQLSRRVAFQRNLRPDEVKRATAAKRGLIEAKLGGDAFHRHMIHLKLREAPLSLFALAGMGLFYYAVTAAKAAKLAGGAR